MQHRNMRRLGASSPSTKETRIELLLTVSAKQAEAQPQMTNESCCTT